MPHIGKHTNPSRLALIIVIVILWSLVIFVRLGHLQFLNHRVYLQQALQRQQLTRAILAPRGIIYDSRMDELATSVNVSTVVAEPQRIEDIPDAAKGLASILNLDPVELLAKMTDPARETYMVVKRRIDPKAEGQVEALGID